MQAATVAWMLLRCRHRVRWARRAEHGLLLSRAGVLGRRVSRRRRASPTVKRTCAHRSFALFGLRRNNRLATRLAIEAPSKGRSKLGTSGGERGETEKVLGLRGAALRPCSLLVCFGRCVTSNRFDAGPLPLQERGYTVDRQDEGFCPVKRKGALGGCAEQVHRRVGEAASVQTAAVGSASCCAVSSRLHRHRGARRLRLGSGGDAAHAHVATGGMCQWLVLRS